MIVLGLIEQFQLCHTRINNCVLHECMDLYVNKIFIHTKHTHTFPYSSPAILSQFFNKTAYSVFFNENQNYKH